MDTHIPEHHPLRQLFGSLAEKVFVEKLGWSDFKVTEYVSTLLVDFTRSDQLYRIKIGTSGILRCSWLASFPNI